MARRWGKLARTLLIALFLGGCATPWVEKLAPAFDEVKHLANIGSCPVADEVRFTTTDIGNMIGRSVKGFMGLAVKREPFATRPEGVVTLGIAVGMSCR